MTYHQIVLFALMGGIFALLLWGRFRYDVVAFGSLFLAYALGVIPKGEVFAGFGHPATIIIALVLVVSRGLSNSGAIELIARHVVDGARSLPSHIGLIASIAAALSALMNNVAALALLMPVDLQAASKARRSPALTLMPLSFASILGGMVTLIGTPPNVVIATFREQSLGAAYTMFDFAPVGLIVAGVGVTYVAFVGWRFIPAERRKHDADRQLQNLGGYIAEGKVPEGSRWIEESLTSLHPTAEEHDVQVLGLVRRGHRLPGLADHEILRKNDIVVLEGAPKAIEAFLGASGLLYAGAEKHGGIASPELDLVEVVVPEDSRIVGRSAMDIRLLYRQGVSLLGVSRRGTRFLDRVRKLRIQAGDVLLLLGPSEQLPDVVQWLGALPLEKRGLQVVQRQKAGVAAAIFLLAIVVASLGWLYLPMALAAVAILYVLLRIVPAGQVYEAVEWPVIVLLGCLIPIGGALEKHGGTQLIAGSIVDLTAGFSPAMVLAILMIVTMTLSDVLNNVATALIAAPIGVDIAQRLQLSPDPFLMAVAVASSCAFLTPIGHKNNTIILGPGGYKFGDFWRMGLPLEVLVIVTGLPAILYFWPLNPGT